MPVNEIRQRFLGDFKHLDLNSRPSAWLIVSWYVLQTLGAMAVGWWLLKREHFGFAEGAALALIMFFIATRFRGFNNIVHECSHFAFSRCREDNATLGSICASLVLGCFRDYRYEHMTHHAHLGDYEKDLDLKSIRDFRLEDPLTPKTILRHVLTPLLLLHYPHYLSLNLSGKDGAFFRAMKIGLILVAVVFLVVDPLAAVLLLWIPFLWIYTAVNYWTDCVDHGGLIGSDNELDASRNLQLPQPLRTILFPRNDCYHLIHHLFPQVPTHHFVYCHESLLNNAEYQARADGSHWPVPAEPAEDKNFSGAPGEGDNVAG